jgi:hypothetical protein
MALETRPTRQQSSAGIAVAILVRFARLGNSQLIPRKFDGELFFRQRIRGCQRAKHKQRRRVQICFGSNLQLPPAKIFPAFVRPINEIHRGKRRWNIVPSTESEIMKPGSSGRLKVRLPRNSDRKNRKKAQRQRVLMPHKIHSKLSRTTLENISSKLGKRGIFPQSLHLLNGLWHGGKQLPEWRNGRRTGLKNSLLAILGHHAPSLATRITPLILLVFYHFSARFPRDPKGRGFLMKLAQNLAQTGKVLCV